MRSTRLPLGGVMLSGKKLTSVSKSCVRWAYVWSTSEKPEGRERSVLIHFKTNGVFSPVYMCKA